MVNELRQAIFKGYSEGQGKISSGSVYQDQKAQWNYYSANYTSYFSPLPKTVKIVEVGSGPGSLLSWLDNQGFHNIKGVDLSPGDVAFTNKHLGRDVACLEDGGDYLRKHPQHFDVILMKAILEHQYKEDLLPLMQAAAQALAPNGFLLIDVPNMDWILAGHERYMDLTHEVGFTRESLQVLLGLCFKNVNVVGSVPPNLTKSQRWFRRPLISLLRRAFYTLGEGASDILFESRSIIAVAR